MSEQHRKFLERFDASDEAVQAVAKHYRKKGYTVELPPIKKAPTAAEAQQFIDDGDGRVYMKRPIEVKGRSLVFTCRKDFPHPTLMIASKHQVERAKDAFSFHVVSADLRYMAVVLAYTKDDWWTEKRLVSNTGNVEEQYFCKLDLVQFVEMER